MKLFLLNFNRGQQVDHQADFAEKMGNVGVGLLRIGFGKTVKVEMLGTKLSFKSEAYSNLARIGAIALAILTLPLTLLLVGLGSLGVALSSSHRRVFNLYQQSLDPKNAVDPKVVENARKIMLETTALAETLDIQIQALTANHYSIIQKDDKCPDGPFRFDLKKWKEVVDQLNTPKLAAKASELMEECRLDLVEALAECNVESSLFDENFDEDPGRLDEGAEVFGVLYELNSKRQKALLDDPSQIDEIKQGRLINEIILPNDISDEQRKIVEEAKNTVKGTLFICDIDYGVEGKSIMFSEKDGHRSGPFAKVGISSLESYNWGSHYYYRCPNRRAFTNYSIYIHLDWLIGQKPGSRIVIPHADELGQDIPQGTVREKQVILRCSPRVDIQTMMTRGIIMTRPNDFLGGMNGEQQQVALPEIVAARRDALEKLEKAYGKSFVDIIEKNVSTGYA